MSPDQQALEAALVAHPDEVAAHSAYADYLAEAGDPRGEFIQTQLALEDPTRSKADRDALRLRETALWEAHGTEWMGELARYLIGEWSGEDKPYHFRFARGWLDFVRTLPAPVELVAALTRAPETRLLRQLEIVYDMRYHPFEFDQFIEQMNEVLPDNERLDTQTFYMGDPCYLLPELIGSPYLTNLRVLKYGFSDDHKDGPSHSTMVDPFGGTTGAQVVDLLKKCPRLEELYLNTDLVNAEELFASPLLGNLRVLQLYYGMTYTASYYAGPSPTSTAFAVLAANPALQALTTLRVHPGREGEVTLGEFDALLNSPNLPALEHLQIHTTTFGDEGANRIVASGILKRLKSLDIAFGNLTDAGVGVLAACPDLKRLEVLNVSHNALTDAGLTALQATGVVVVADDQHAAGDYYSNYSVDWE